MSEKNQSPAARAREARLAKALKENLARRKALTREKRQKDSQAKGSAEDDEAGDTPPRDGNLD
jgi:hypothetical protein